MVLGAPSADSASRRATCSFSAAEHTLTVRGRETILIKRQRASLVVIRPYEDGRPAIACSGARATTRNTDTVEVRLARGINHLLLGFGKGRFAPGATREGDGSSEIEFEVTVLNEGRGSESWVELFSGRRSDHFRYGIKDGNVGINLNADETSPDIDLTVLGPGPEATLVLGRRGKDRITTTGGPEFDTAILPQFGPAVSPPMTLWAILGSGNDTLISTLDDALIEAGPGNDRVLAGPGRDIIRGEQGADRLSGGDGPDSLFLGIGRDSATGGDGGDLIKSADGIKEFIACDEGDDRAQADQRDSLSDCERVKRRNP